MVESRLRQIEDAKGKHFSALQIDELLQKDSETGEFSNLNVFIEKNKEKMKSLYGDENIEEDFRKDLEERMKQIEELIYLKRIEETLSKKVERTITENRKEVREKIIKAMGGGNIKDEKFSDKEIDMQIKRDLNKKFREKIRKTLKLGHESPIDMFSLEELRGTRNISDFKSLHISVDEEYIQAYRKLVQYEIQKQLEEIGEMNHKSKQKEQEQQFSDLYQQSDFLFNFFVSHIDAMNGERAYLRGYLLKKVQSEDGAKLIQDLYKKIQQAVRSDNTKEIIQDVVSELKISSGLERKDHIKEMINECSKENVKDEELSVLLGESYFIGNDGVSYQEKLSNYFESIEYLKFDIALKKMKGSFYKDDEKGINNVKKDVVKTINQFRDQYYTTDRMIDTYFSSQSHEKIRKLKESSKAISYIRGVETKYTKEKKYGDLIRPILEKLKSLSGDDDIDKYIQDCEDEVREYIINNGIDEKTIKRLEGSNPLFNIFSYFRHCLLGEEDNLTDFSKGYAKIEDCHNELQNIKKFEGLYKAKSSIRLLAFTGKLDQKQIESLQKAITFSDSLEEDQKNKANEELQRFVDILNEESVVSRFDDLKGALEIVFILGNHGKIDKENSKEILDHCDSLKFSEHEKAQVQEKLMEFSKQEDEKMEKEKKSDMEHVLDDEESLKKIRGWMSEMNKICENNFKEKDDQSEFRTLDEKIQSELIKHKYLAEEIRYDHEGKALTHAGEPVIEKKRRVKKLPFEDREKLYAMRVQRDRMKQFSHLYELRLGNLNNPKDLQEGLKAIMGGHFELVKDDNQLEKLVKVMSLDHPLTSIRHKFSAPRDPFLFNKKYEIHRIPGEEMKDPATFADRARYVLEEAMKAIKSRNFNAISDLFNEGKPGRRLFVDASFFPVKKLKSKDDVQNTFYRITEGNVEIDKKLIGREEDRGFFKKKIQSRIEKIDPDEDIDALMSSVGGQSLIDDESFLQVFGTKDMANIKVFAKYQDALRFNEDGTLNPELTEEAIQAMKEHVASGGEVKGLDTESLDTDGKPLKLPGDNKINEETLGNIMKEYPLIATRMMQMNSMVGGSIVGGVETVAKGGIDFARTAIGGSLEIGKMYWKDLDFYTPISIWHAIDQMIEHIEELADFRTKTASYKLLKNVFDGTLVGNEFAKLYQSQENKRVDEFKDSFSQFGHDELIEKLYTAADSFELKAALSEGYENRGIITTENILDKRFIKNLNKYTTTIVIPTQYSKDEMVHNEDIRIMVLDKIEKAINEIWGKGGFQSWRSAGVSKYESMRQQASDEFAGRTTSEKPKIYNMYWNMLKTEAGINELKTKHPAEIVGNIEQDMIMGDNDGGMTFGLMQAMVSMGIVKLEHLRRLQNAHTNDLPIYAILEPKEAEISGLTQFIKDTIRSGSYDKLSDGNPVYDFFQGNKAIKLKTYRAGGKWRFAKTEGQAAENKVENVVMTVHQLQKVREAQPGSHKTMDNSSMGIFQPCYDWGQIEGALQVDTNGKINDRPHDTVSGFRGMHYEFAGYMEALADPEIMKGDELEFKRTVWMAYMAMTKTQAYAAFLARQVGRENDFNTNTLDASPNKDSKHTETRARSGKTNYETLILDESGIFRMGQSATKLDGLTGMSDELRKSFKKMAGYQFVKGLGVRDNDGRSGGEYKPYDFKEYDPSGTWMGEVMPAFMKNVRKLAKQHGLESAMVDIEASNMGNINMDNNTRISSLGAFRNKLYPE